MFLLIFPAMLFSQSGEKYSVNMNSLGPVDKFGSSNYAPVRIFTNSTLRALFTADGNFEAWYDSYFKKNVTVDSTITAWEMYAMYRLSVYGDVVVTGIMKSAKLILTDGNITSMTGTVDFGSNNLSTTGNVTAGSFNSPTFAGNGKGLITYDLSGTLGQLQFTGNANKVLLGDGTWGAVPIPQNYWQMQNDDIYTLTPGNIGMGMNNPAYKLDVAGTVRISEDLLVGGGIIISEKVNATRELKSASLRADSIFMDSTKAFYGYSKFAGDVKLENKLDVTGDVKINGNVNSFGNITTLGNVSASGSISALALNNIVNSVNCSGTSNFRIQYNYTGSIDGCTTPSSTWDLMAIKENDINHRFEIRTPEYAGPIFTLTNDGKAKIGAQSITTGPHSDYKLAVDGKIVAHKMITTAQNWADDEFDVLASFDELQKEQEFIIKNKHLRLVPSEKDVLQNGIEMSEMFTIQIRKIEQLFKYTFLLSDEILQIKDENSLLKINIKELQKQINELKLEIESFYK